MSTKALRDLVALAEAATSPAHKALTVDAKAELDAIEKAAVRASGTPWLAQLRMHPDTCEDAALVEAIAKSRAQS